MAHEKRGVVEPGRTPDIERTHRPGEKQAGSRQQQASALDDDFTKRAADAAAERLKRTGS